MNENEPISDKLLPIQPIWALRNSLSSLITLPISLIIIKFYFLSRDSSNHTSLNLNGSMLVTIFIAFFLCAGSLLHFIFNLINRAQFHFLFEKDYLTMQQGIFSKQQRHLPYGVIQNITVTQGIFDRLFGLANLKIENASQGGGQVLTSVRDQRYEAQRDQNTVGFFGNKIIIPGLSYDHCQYLKQLLELEVTNHPVNPNQSGL